MTPELLTRFKEFRAFFDDVLARGPAKREADHSLLPGEHNGPADAYRHMLAAAEARRRFGEEAAWFLAMLNEARGNAEGQGRGENDMDWVNNNIGLRIGETVETWEEVVSEVRKEVDKALAHDGKGDDGTAVWFPEKRWSGKPDALNWPPDWSKALPIDPPYEFGGRQWRFENLPDTISRPLRMLRVNSGPSGSNAAMLNLLFSGSPPWPSEPTPGHLLFDEEGNVRPRGGDGAVHVRAHARDGGKVRVGAYDRSPPQR